MSALKAIFLISILYGTHAKRDYSGYKVLSIPGSDNLRAIADKYLLDVWKESRYGENHVMVTPENEALVLKDLHQHGISWEVYIDDVQRLIDDENQAILAMGNHKVFDYNNFNPFEEFETELQRLAANCPEGFQCEVTSIGQTYEGNEMNMLHISQPGSENKRAYWIDAMIHCREWLAGATLMNITHKLITDYGSDPEATQLLDNYDWYLLPVMNPDGYIHTWDEERLWRKNRRPNEGSSCLGTDLNRNYEYEWGGVGASANPCSDTYRGDNPASEPVTIHTQAEMERLGPSLNAWVSLHTYGQLWLTPWAYFIDDTRDCDLPEDYADLLAVATAATDAVGATHGTNWEPGNWCNVLYESSGVLQDHAKGQAGIKYAFTPELRGPGFIVDPSSIQPSSEEIWNGLVAMVNNIEDAN